MTWGCDIFNANVLNMCHVTQRREDDETGKETGATVDSRHD